MSRAALEATAKKLVVSLVLGICVLAARAVPAADTAPESYQVAVVLHGEGKTTEARAAFEAILASWDTPENRGNADFDTVLGGSHYHLGEILFAEDRHAEAAEHYRAVIDSFVTYRVESYYHLGLGRLYRKDYSGALETLGELLASYPTATLAAHAMYYRAVCLQLMGDRAAAASAFGEMAQRYPQHDWSQKALERAAELGRAR